MEQPHQCSASCVVTHEFGNAFKCHSSGLLHICDNNCDQRLYNDRYSSICRVSRRMFPPLEERQPGLSSRKRASTDCIEAAACESMKRQFSTDDGQSRQQGMALG